MISSTIYHRGKFINKTECQKIKECPYCKSNSLEVVKREENTSHGYWMRCEKCCLNFVNEVPYIWVLDNYYLNYYSIDSEQKVTADNPIRIAKRIYNKVSSDLIRRKDTCIKILDWGGGDGTLSVLLAGNYLKDFKVEITNVDYHAQNNSNSVNYPNINYQAIKNLDEINEEFDLIICSAILEHVPSINENVNLLFKLLSPKGCIYFRTPYMIPFKRVLGKFQDMTYPAHIYDIGYDFYEFIASEYGVKTIYLGPSVIETALCQNFLRTLLSFFFKVPYIFLGRKWKFVGGVEFVAKKI
jgi:2-polyprenyl-3-methyl-5-hydroxy-6-metoxy-1,4-benzoquinol methylase